MTVPGGRNVGTTATTPVDTPSSVGVSWRRADIQGLRALAVLAVIAFHADLPVPGGFTGVDIFFVISGYVITLLLLRQHAQGRLSLGTFYARRAQRLLPALAVMIAVVFVLSWLIESPFGAQQTTAATGIGAMLLVANVVIVRSVGDYFASAAEANPLLNTWSLSVEEQFYLAFPLIVMLILIRGKRRHALFAIVAAMTVISFALAVSFTAGWNPGNITSQPQAWAFYLSPFRAWEFGAGALLAIAVARHSWKPTAFQSKVLAAAGAILVIASLWGINPQTPFPGVAALLPVLGTSALIAAGVKSNPVSRVFATKPAVLIGDASYSLYLWHWPIIVLALVVWPEPFTPALAAVVSVVPAILSYRYLENPIRALAMSRRAVAIGGVTVIAIVAALGVLLSTFGPRSIPGLQDVRDQRATPVASEQAGCFLLKEFEPSLMDDCWFRAPGGQGWILLAGDSHASHLSNAIIDAAHARYRDVFSVTGGACPFLLVPVGASDVPNCDEMNQSIWQLIRSDNPPDAVVLGDKGLPTGLPETIEQIQDAGVPVVLVRDVPRWAPLNRRVQNLPCTGGVLTFTCSFDRAAIDEYSMANRQQEEALLQSNTNLISVDPWPLFCDEERCSAMKRGALEYVDNEHLNGLGSRRLAPLMDGALAQVIG